MALNHSLARSLTHSLTRSLTHSLTHTHTHTHTHTQAGRKYIRGPPLDNGGTGVFAWPFFYFTTEMDSFTFSPQDRIGCMTVFPFIDLTHFSTKRFISRKFYPPPHAHEITCVSVFGTPFKRGAAWILTLSCVPRTE